MKKAIFISFLFVMGYNLFSQSNPIMGYDKVKWGTSINEVVSVYDIDSDKISENTVWQRDVSESISRRRFYFKEGFLYKVEVDYKKSDSRTLDTLREILIERYGVFKYSTSSVPTIGGYIRSRTYSFEQYYPDLLVELVFSSHSAGSFFDTISIIYSNVDVPALDL